MTLLCGALALGGSVIFIEPMYRASALFYVNNSVSLGDASLSISSGDISTSKSLVVSYMVILKTRNTLLEVIDYADSNRSYNQLLSMISASSVNNTEFFKINVHSSDPKEAEQIANAIAYVISKRIATIIEGSSAKVVDYAVEPGTPYSPNYTENTVMGLIIGCVLSVAVVILSDLLNITIKDEDDVQNCCNYPVLALVPDMGDTSKFGYYRGYYRHKNHYVSRNKKNDESSDSLSNMIGQNVSFTASEAYNLLRTKLLYSFVDEKVCHVFAISSALAGEGKSISSINLAYSLAQLNKRVLLIDCDMRRPTLAKKMGLNKYPGLSEYLTGFLGLRELLQTYQSGEDASLISVLTAGITPPNPVELLNSEKMSDLIASIRKDFDFVILDMPPICDVSDALVSAKIADGVILVVRQHYSTRIAIKDAVKQFEYVDTKILGTVFNCISDKVGTYKRRKYSYGKRYG